MIHRFDRRAVKSRPLAERDSLLDIEGIVVDPATWKIVLSDEARDDVGSAATEILASRARGAPVILAFGAHAIKNGLSNILITLMKRGFVTHFATNGAGVIHDWEFASTGRSSEDVRRNLAEGRFGTWEETGAFINLALALGAWKGQGYGESVGAMIVDGGLRIPDDDTLCAGAAPAWASDASIAELEGAAAAADLRALLREAGIKPGFLAIDHPHARFSLAAAARRADLPFTCHPMFGHDIIYTHPLNRGAAIGRTAERDFLSFVDSVSHLEGGVYLSLGSAVMSPMIFEKALSMARNAALGAGRRIEDFDIHVVDLATSAWDWKGGGEPPRDDPAYYLRYCKTFSRAGARMRYASADNRSWLAALLLELERREAKSGSDEGGGTSGGTSGGSIQGSGNPGGGPQGGSGGPPRRAGAGRASDA